MTKISTQAEFNVAFATGDRVFELVGDATIVVASPERLWLHVYAAAPHVVARESSQPHVVAMGSSQPHVVAMGSSQPRVEARGSSQPHVEAWGSSQPHVVAMGSSQPHVVAMGSSQPHVEARESSQPHVEARESSQPHVEAMGSSQPHVVAWGSSQPHVVAWESSQPRVVAWGSSQPRVEARESSQPHVVAWGSSQPHVVAWGSSQPHVEAWGSSQPHVVAMGSSQPHVEATGYTQLSVTGRVTVTAAHHVAVLIHDAQANVVGGQQTHVARATPKEWCEYYGVPVDDDGVAVLYKALDDDFRSPHGMSYAPGTKPVASDWDGLARECGGGLHFSPRPLMAKEFHEAATKYAACPVRLADIVVHPDADYPQKVKARACCAPVWECDDLGHPIGPTTI